MSENVATEPAEDVPAEVQLEDKRKAWNRRVSVDAATFFLAFTLAMVSAFDTVRGPVVVVQPPQQLVLYRDGEGDNAVLIVAMRLAMINATSANHGDVVMNASISPLKGGPSFGFAATVKPVFTDDESAASKCDLGARCVPLDGLLVIEREDEIIDIPGGTVRGPYLAYPVADWNCTGDAKVCGEFLDFNSAVAKIAQSSSDFTVKVTFYSDGERSLNCKGRAIDLAYITSRGWMTVNCD
ncbi:MAG: hypothetical protein EAY70_07115, partial [Sphingomonadales bacterium]